MFDNFVKQMTARETGTETIDQRHSKAGFLCGRQTACNHAGYCRCGRHQPHFITLLLQVEDELMKQVFNEAVTALNDKAV
jgi:hypothetical protein